MKKKNEIENHKVETTLAQSWGVYNLYNQKMETPAVFFIYRLKQVSDFPFPPDLEPP